MKAVTQAIITTVALLGACLWGSAVLAQAPTVNVTVKPSAVPVPLTVVRGTLVVFQGTISQQMEMTTFALRNDYGEFIRGDFLDSWKLTWNTAVEHDPTEQIAVYWSRAGGAATRMTRYNVKLIEAIPFLLRAETAGGKTTVTITPTGSLTAQKYTLSLDGAATSLTVDEKGRGVLDTSHLRPGSHTLGASALLADGSVSAVAPVTFVVPAPPPAKTHKPVPAATAKRRAAHSGKTRHT